MSPLLPQPSCSGGQPSPAAPRPGSPPDHPGQPRPSHRSEYRLQELGYRGNGLGEILGSILQAVPAYEGSPLGPLRLVLRKLRRQRHRCDGNSVPRAWDVARMAVASDLPSKSKCPANSQMS